MANLGQLLGQLLGHCDALEQRLRESRRLAGPGPSAGAVAVAPEPEVAVAPAAPRRGCPRKPALRRGQQINFDDGLLFE